MNVFRVYPAPYIADPERLVCHTSQWPQAAFVRLRNPASPNHVTDIFYAGHTRNWSDFYDAESPGHWQKAYLKMLRFENGLPLVGCLAYEAGFQFEANRWCDLPLVDGQAMFLFLEMDVWYQVDHASRVGAIYAAPETPQCTVDSFTDYLRVAMDHRTESDDDLHGLSSADDELVRAGLSGELTQAEYVATVENILEDIRSGRYYELNFTQRFYQQSACAPSSVFLRLMRRLNPAYAFYGKFHDQFIVSASPELFLHKEGDMVQTCPIKGSYRHVPSQDEMSKLHAEHTMVIDLARNDIGRISDRGWVRVPEPCVARQFGEITHLESRIIGQTSRGLDEILAATLPAASITGTPKVISVQSIAEYEQSARGIYTGNCGVLWPHGDLQLNVAIRTLHASPKYEKSESSSKEVWNYTLGSGGAIVADSDPEQEYQECLMKVAPLIAELNAG